MAERDDRAKKIVSLVRPVLDSIIRLSGKEIPWGSGGIPSRERAEALLAEGEEDLGRHLRAYYSALSALRNQASSRIKWGKGEIPELEHMDSTLAGLYAFISEYVLGYESGAVSGD